MAEAAGQLGVKTADVAGFTETMIARRDHQSQRRRGRDEASPRSPTSWAPWTGSAPTASTALPRLSWPWATTVPRPSATSSTWPPRIAGAAKVVVRLSRPDLLAVSNALASVGIEAEAGGTAFSNVLIDMSKAIKTGNSDLEGFARVAGMSTEQFAQAFEDRPAAAVDAFTQGSRASSSPAAMSSRCCLTWASPTSA